MVRNRIIHLIPSLDQGGTERILCTLLAQVDARETESRVITLVNSGLLGQELLKHGIKVDTLGMRWGSLDPFALSRLAGLLRRYRPDLVVTWLCHANLLGGIASLLAGHVPVIWNIRNTHLDPLHTKRLTRASTRLAGFLSRWLPAQTVYVGNSSRVLHSRLGYTPRNASVVTNGYDLRTYYLNPLARREVRSELGLQPETPLIGLFGRFHPDKDHETFIQAAAQIRANRPDVRFLLCGRDVHDGNEKLVAWIRRANLAEHCLLLGLREDMPRLIASLDLMVSSSVSEGLPGVIGEAMSCEVPCVATDVGDCATLIGTTGRIVPPRDHLALARVCFELLRLPMAQRQQLGITARQRISEHFNFDRMVSQHFDLWAKLIGKPVPRRPTLMPLIARQAA